jgi:hypothetical protein
MDSFGRRRCTLASPIAIDSSDFSDIPAAYAAAIRAGLPLFIAPNPPPLTAPLEVTSPGVKIFGASKAQTTIRGVSGLSELFHVHGKAAIEFEMSNLTLDTAGQASRCMLIDDGAQVIRITNVGFSGDQCDALLYSAAAGFVQVMACDFEARAPSCVGLTFDGSNLNSLVGGGTRFGNYGCGLQVVMRGASHGLDGLSISDIVSICTGEFAIKIGGNSNRVAIGGVTILDQAAGYGVWVGERAQHVSIIGAWIGMNKRSGFPIWIDGSAGNDNIIMGNDIVLGSISVVVGASNTARVGNTQIIGNRLSGYASCALQLDSIDGGLVANNIASEAGLPSLVTVGTHPAKGHYTLSANRWSGPLDLDPASTYIQGGG